ncbi:hypothetical protein LU699_06965 [Luteimonas fraxinea]|uniref:DUF262 domain-containing protein n=1 Tax=Luteimonas fraxinea TaxID=2901869 RepID=A0ABS8U9A4_9GAMM|nr:hypothetical protein [Luteimonas fraxinea]MCD9095351.1 hypothetical protein [Luteimonas fraxinea]UHH11435.1 hypothetical protein LU699_06965 [Luteimonas fraxinea]
MIEISSIDKDEVISSWVLTGCCDYRHALQVLFPLVDRFEAQRKIQSPAFYERLRRDILGGCIMPPITVAIVDPEDKFSLDFDFKSYINENLANGYILDGMQRLNNLKAVSEDPGFDGERRLYVSIVIADKKDMLLYRMITLNNGQKPMSPRHQIEVLTQELFDFRELSVDVQTEKERSERVVRGAFNLGDISKGYLAFLTENLHNDNNRIIAEKMDELIISKIMQAGPVEGVQFQSVLEMIDRFAENAPAKNWLKAQNNIVGFCVGVKHSYDELQGTNAEEFGTLCEKFDEAFKAINASKVNLGKYRRELSFKYIKSINVLKKFSVGNLIEWCNDETAT